MYKSVALLLFLISSTTIWAQKTDELIDLKFKQVSIDQKQYFMIDLKLEKGWHVYWKNPGDSGIPTEWKFQSKKNSLKLTMLEWPAPTLYKEAGDLWTYGYSGENTFFANINNQSNQTDELLVVTEFLVCKELCIPAKFTFNFDIKNQQIIIPEDLQSKKSIDDIKTRLAQLPQIENLPSSWSWKLYRLENTNQLKLQFEFPELTTLPKNQHLLTTFPSQPLNFRHFSLSSTQLLMDIDWDGQYLEPAVLLPENNKFQKPYIVNFLWHQTTEKTSVISLPIDQFETITLPQWNQLTTQSTNASSTSTSNLTSNFNSNFLLMLIFALIGGFILNFMPCVLPVISIKLYGLIQHTQKSRSALLKHHFSYTLGIVVSFWILALIIIVLKQSGEVIGWGFQLQSPVFVWCMILLFFLLSLNLFGLFEFKTPGGKIIANLRSNHPYIDDFLAGLLAVIVATPCSAPFLGPALTYAFSKNSLVIICMFTMMGLGLAFPFIITAIIPSSLAILPRPGAWMNTFKYLMGLALLITCVWLLEVLQYLGDYASVSFLVYFSLILIFFTLFIYQKEKKLSSLVIFMIFFSLFNTYRTFNLLNTDFKTNVNTNTHVNTNNSTTTWIEWNEDAINQALNKQELFFIDATARWCITCQVNKKLVFDTDGFKEFAQKYQIKTIRLDWTKKDDVMFKWMQKYGAVSVPAYFLGVKGKIIFLGETISIKKIEDALQNP